MGFTGVVQRCRRCLAPHSKACRQGSAHERTDGRCRQSQPQVKASKRRRAVGKKLADARSAQIRLGSIAPHGCCVCGVGRGKSGRGLLGGNSAKSGKQQASVTKFPAARMRRRRRPLPSIGGNSKGNLRQSGSKKFPLAQARSFSPWGEKEVRHPGPSPPKGESSQLFAP
jgi:hypothetical protein